MTRIVLWCCAYAAVVVGMFTAWLWLCQCDRCGAHWALHKIDEDRQLCGRCATLRRR